MSLKFFMTNTLKIGLIKVTLAIAFLYSAPSAMNASQHAGNIEKAKKNGNIEKAKKNIIISQPNRSDAYRIQESENDEIVDQEKYDQDNPPAQFGQKNEQKGIIISKGQHDGFVLVSVLLLGVSIWQMVESIMLWQKSN